MDPQVQITVRRVLAARRAVSKDKEIEKLIDEIIHLYEVRSRD